MSDRKYYTAYDDRYLQVHEQNLEWFSKNPSSIVSKTICDHSISHQHKILEIGCGEGRDAFPLLEQGYDLLATDVSSEVITFCQKKMPDFANNFQVLDCVAGQLASRFDFIYAVAVVHMLVLNEDRNAFYRFIREHLNPDGIALICSMGDGEIERESDISTAFELQERIHQFTGTVVQIAGTSCKMVNFQTFDKAIEQNGLVIINQGITAIEPDFSQMTFAVVKVR